MEQAYVYMWKEIATDKWYIGSRTRKGCHPDDGYICSSKTVKPLIQANPEGWTRKILFVGDAKRAIEIESFTLIGMRAKQSEMSYNLHNQDMKWTRTGCKDTPEVLLKKSKARLGANNPSYGKCGELSPNWGRKHKPRSPETLRKMSAARKGKPSPTKGRKMPPMSDERKARQSAALKGRVSPMKGRKNPNAAEANKKRAGEKRPATSLALLGKTWTHVTKVCPHCKTIGAGGNMLRYHFENCKHKGNENGIA
jgi:NUMOD3 motif